ncbi:MAG: membrane lipoprotein lipid attachment site-containing protein [Clostridia bacterium]|nr:membrane lipoprotein lipid attachment site-containing protein [Clostridia bacterium]
MKRIFFFATAVLMLLSMAACSSSGGKSTGKIEENISQSDFSAKQQKVIDTFGISVENNCIVGYQYADEYLEYIVVKYDNGKKTGEAIHRFYSNESYYQNALVEFGLKNPAIIKDDASCSIKMATNTANTGDYKTDFEAVDKIYTVKTLTGNQ